MQAAAELADQHPLTERILQCRIDAKNRFWIPLSLIRFFRAAIWDFCIKKLVSGCWRLSIKNVFMACEGSDILFEVELKQTERNKTGGLTYERIIA